MLDRLDAFDSLAVAPSRYLHVTVTVVGDVTTAGGRSGTVAPTDLDALADDLGEALTDVAPFDVRFPRLNVFPTVVYAEVDDGGQFVALNDRACAVDAVPVHDRDRQFVPHAALAEFRDEDVTGVVDALERDRSLDVGPVRVDRLDLVRVGLDDRFPRFERLRRFALD
nr:2'-5' RNA ligase family protein [Halomarina rubra]